MLTIQKRGFLKLHVEVSEYQNENTKTFLIMSNLQ